MSTRFFENAAFGYGLRRDPLGALPLPGFGFLYADFGVGGPRFNDVQAEETDWNRSWSRRFEATERFWCVCSKKIVVDKDAMVEQLVAAGWHQAHDDRGEHGCWYCSIACEVGEAVERERWKPRRRLAWWAFCGVNAWIGVGRHITAENLPAAYGRG